MSILGQLADFLDSISKTRAAKYIDSLTEPAYTRRLKKFYFSITPEISIGWTNRLSILFGDSRMYVKESMCLAIGYAGIINLCFHYSMVLVNDIYSDGQFICGPIKL